MFVHSITDSLCALLRSSVEICLCRACFEHGGISMANVARGYLLYNKSKYELFGHGYMTWDKKSYFGQN